MKLTGQINGNATGQLGKAVIYFNWKGIACGRVYKKPGYRDTDAQRAQRHLFSEVLMQAQDLLGIFIKSFWKKHAIHMSEFNAWMGKNLLSQNFPLVKNKFVMSLGSLEPVPILSCLYSSTTGSIHITYDNTVYGNGSASDLVSFCIYNDATGRWIIDTSGTLRSASSKTITIATGQEYDNIQIYAFAYKDLNKSSFVCSNDNSMTCSEA